MLNTTQIDAYKHDGYLKVAGLFSPQEVEALEAEMNWIIKEWWGEESIGWRGPWRDHYLSEEERRNTKAVFIGNPQFYSAAWGRIIFHEGLVGCLQDLIGHNVQWHHTILHGKPPQLGTPFPMHQDYPFYPHDGPDFVDCLVHLDDTPIDSGCLRVVPGSHKDGPLEHITGEHTRPYLPTDKYHPDKVETVAVPARAGDVIFFSYCTIHWSDVNRTNQWRKSVRIGYHSSQMRPVGMDATQPNNKLMVGGLKRRGEAPKLTYR
jgi:phytanoyl-CoA hydroxylase